MSANLVESVLSPPPASQHTVKQHNRALVLRRVASAPGQTRARIALEAGLTRATVSTLVDELIEDRLVIELEPATVRRGRPGNPLHLNPLGPAAVGIEINVDHTSACVLDFTGAARARRTIAADNANTTPRLGLRRAVRLATALASAAGCPVAGVALALPGLVSVTGILGETPNLPRWSGAEVHALLGAMIGGAPVAVDNEANLAALAEHRYGTAVRDFLYVSGEIGVGGALVVDGDVFRGMRGFAGEIGHVLVNPAGPVCACGNRGCLERLAGKNAVLRSAHARDEDDLVARATCGERRVLNALRSTAIALGVGLGAAINIIDVPTVVLGGFYARLGQWLTEPLSAELARRVVSRRPVEVHVSTVGADAAMLGAAGSVIERIITTAAWPATRPDLQ